MKEFIEELKNNKKIENTSVVDIDYVIERLESISKTFEKHVDWFSYHNKNFNEDQDYHMLMIYDCLHDKGVFRK